MEGATVSPTRLVHDARTHVSQPLFRSAYSLMASTVVTSVLGVAFWILAARLFPPEVVGRDSALIASMLTLSTIAQLNFASAMIRFLPRMGARTSRVLGLAYALSAVAALVIALAFVVIVPRVIDDFAFVAEDPGVAAMYVAGLVMWGVFVIGDASLAGLRCAPWVPIENAIYAVLKMAALPILLAVTATHGIFAAWILPVCLLLPVMNWLIFRRAIPRHLAGAAHESSSAHEFTPRHLRRFLAQDYFGSVLSQGALTLLPLLVVALLGSEDNAYFYVAFTLVTTFDLLFMNVVTSFTVEGAVERERLHELSRTVVRHLLAPLVVISLGLVLVAPLLLLPFGPDYVREASPLVRLLACACVFRAALYLYAALCRLHGRGRPLLLVEAGAFTLLIGLTLLLTPVLGLKGVALAWVITHAVLACAVAQPLLRALRGRPAPASRPSTITLREEEGSSEPYVVVPTITCLKDEGSPEPYVVVLESPDGSADSFRWASEWQRIDALREFAGVRTTRANAARILSKPRRAAGFAAAPAAAEPRDSRSLVVTAAVAACILAPLLVALDAPDFLRFPAVLVLFCVAPGGALLQHLPPRQRPFEVGLVVVTSLALATLGAQSMLWLEAWQPELFLHGLAGASLLALAAGLLRKQGARA
jgi:O-antigen/teichoic acid export membrane protein